MASIPFSKYSGCGNDFILIDNRANLFKPLPDLVRQLCHRREGVGADGIVLLENGNATDYSMRIFNSDGSEAEMCGNGLRCLGKFIQEIESRNDQTIEVHGQLYTVSVKDDLVEVSMPPPIHIHWGIEVPLEHEIFTADFLDTGVPHLVMYRKDLNTINLAQYGPRIRNHSLFAPKGSNVNFFTILPNQTVPFRTYERGVEGETPACGTGAAAVAISALIRYGLSSPVKTVTSSGEFLIFDIKEENKTIKEITMKGPVKKIYIGTLIPRQ